MNKPEFVYVMIIKTTPEQLWQALTESEFIRRYYQDTGPSSDWQVGSPVRWKSSPDGAFGDHGQVVLEADRPRRLSYSWHNYMPENAAMFGWSEERLAELRKEPISQVTFDIERVGQAVKLTVTHDGFVPGSEMLAAVSQGWPLILSHLKTLLETGETLTLED